MPKLGQDDPLELYADALKIPARQLDVRLDKAVTMLELGASVAEIGTRLRVSRSHLSHLFTERFGTPLRAWRPWLLLRWAMLEVYSGISITEAAHSAGFADAAQLSRTHRNTLGVPPMAHVRVLSGQRVRAGVRLRRCR